MTPDKWAEQSIEETYLWCNAFRKKFGDFINQYAREYNVPEQLLAGVIANEMLDWHFPDGTSLDGLRGGGVGFAQISISTARKYGFNNEIRQMLNSVDGSVRIAAKILSDYIQEFKKSQTNGTLGSGFIHSDLYYKATPHILMKENLVNLQIPGWLLNTMCAAWNSGIDIIHAKDKIGEHNYRNANIHGQNSSILLNYLPKLVNP